MAEQQVKVYETAKGKNIKINDLEFGNHTVVEKQFIDGKEITTQFGPSYLCKVLYAGDEVAMFLSATQHKMFAEAGGQGDKVEIHRYIETKDKKPATRYKFVKVD